ncbi:MAG: pseudaminic acid synthase [Cyclobacteriaceae bacterium]
MNPEILKIDDNHPTLIIAELSANHAHDKNVALDTVRAAKDVGADGIKLQTYTPDTLTIDCNNEYFKINNGTLWDGRNLYDLYKEAYTPWEWHEEIFELAHDLGLYCFSTPFDISAVDFLEQLHVPAYKIASFEIRDIPLIRYAASKKKMMIISTGIATFEDIQLAVDTCLAEGNSDIVLLKCTSSYPAPIELANISTMSDMKSKFACRVGLSDHTVTNDVPIVAVSNGACLIEKHFILNKKLGGPDASFSLDPNAFELLVQSVRQTEKILGKVDYTIPSSVKQNVKFARSLFIVQDVNQGDLITAQNVRSIRPGYGLHPKYLEEIMGRKFTKKLERGTPLELNHFME